MAPHRRAGAAGVRRTARRRGADRDPGADEARDADRKACRRGKAGSRRAAGARPRAVLRQPRDRGRAALAGRPVRRVPEAVEGHAQHLRQEDGRALRQGPPPHDRGEAADPGVLLDAATAGSSCTSRTTTATRTSTSGPSTPRRRTPTARRPRRRATSPTRRALARSSTRCRRSRPTRSTSASTTATPRGTTSTASRSRPASVSCCGRTPTASRAGCSTSTASCASPCAPPTRATPRSCKVAPDGFQPVYTCSVFETCGPEQFHKDGQRVYMQTNKGDVDLTRLVLFDPATGKEELVESDPLKRVDFGGAIFSEATDELVGTTLRGRAGAVLLPRQGVGGGLQAAPVEVPRQGDRASAPRRRTTRSG